MTAAVVIVQLPSPPHKNIFREWSGGMGTALASSRESWGHDQQYYDIPYSAYLYIARCLQEAGISFRYRDFQDSKHVDLEAIDALFREERPRVLVTQVNLPSLEHDLDLIRRCKRVAPGGDLRVILVGATAKWFKARILRDGLADVVMEEAEELLVSENVAALLEDRPEALQGCHVWRDGVLATQPARKRMTSLNFIEFPAYELLDFSRYESDYYLDRHSRYATVFTTKGCPYRCGYCPYPYGFGRRLIYRSPEHVGADVERLQEEFGVQQILFRDQVFTINPKHAQAVCEELIRRNLDVVWVCETRYDLVDEDLLRLMHRAGCREIHFGLESGDEVMFAQVAKSDGPQSLALFERAIGWTRSVGMRVHLHCIVGLPDESWRSVRNTTKFLRRTRPDSVQFAYFVPYPGTPLFDELNQSGEFGNLNELDWEDLGSFTGPVLPSRRMSVDEIRRARHRLSVDWHYTLADRVLLKLKRTLGALPAPTADKAV